MLEKFYNKVSVKRSFRNNGIGIKKRDETMVDVRSPGAWKGAFSVRKAEATRPPAVDISPNGITLHIPDNHASCYNAMLPG